MKLLLLLTGFFSAVCVWAQPAPLPVDKAFPVRVWSPSEHTIIVELNIQPGYYLYRDRLQFSPAAEGVVQLGEPHFPPAINHFNRILGTFPAYDQPTQIIVPVESAPVQQFLLQVKFQGCAEQGYCYPPVTRVVPVHLSSSVVGLSAAGLSIDRIPPTRNEKTAAHYHWTTWLSFFAAGLLISLTPCVLPMIPVLFAMIMGKTVISHLRAFLISLCYVLGMAVTYAFVGIVFGIIGSSMQAVLQKPWIIVLFSLIFVAMALALFGFYQLEPPKKLRALMARVSNRQRSGSLVGAAIMGSLSTLILSPCATPPLVAALSYIGQTGDAYLGGLSLFVIGLGSGIPLLLIGALGRKFLPKSGPWMRVVENILGIILLGVAIGMMGRILPEQVTMVLWAVWLIGLAVYMRAFNNAVNWIQRLSKGIGILIFVASIMILLNVLQLPGKFFLTSSTAPALRFTTVKTVADVQRQLAQAQDKPVLLDFYADWCVSCKIMECTVFADPLVQQRLAGFKLLRADVTKNDRDDVALMRYFKVVAPPTLIIFNRQHQEVPEARIIGEVSATQFLNQIHAEGAGTLP